MRRLFFSIFFLVFIVGKPSLSFEFWGTRGNYCSKVISYEENVTIPESKKMKESYKDWCFTFTLRCIKHRYVTVNISKIVTVQKTKRVYDCCRGFEKKNNACVPICRLGCGHGKCIEPDRCLCEPGWREPWCLSECEVNRYGRGCIGICTCFRGECDQKTGACLCTPGYTGDQCQYPCPKNTYGQDCKSKCKCMNGAMCDLKNGDCECNPGYEGEYCEKPCKKGSHGKDCGNQCICIPENTESCSHVDGKCKCKPGYKGEFCDKECDEFTYGQNCSKKCKCVNSEFCDNIDGECYCKPGWTGEMCSSKCPIGKFGENCNFKCDKCLTISGNCDHITGDCYCPPGKFGALCEKTCPIGYWGSNCSKLCDCYGIDFCDPENGECPASTTEYQKKKMRNPLLEKYNYRSDKNIIAITVCTIMLITIVIGTVCIWGYIKKETLQSMFKMPFLNLYVHKKRRHKGNDKLSGSSINNPVYEIPPEVILESEQIGRGFIRGSFSSGVMYVKNNENNLDIENKQTNVKSDMNLPLESNKNQSHQKDSEYQKTVKKEILTDLKDAFKEIRRCSVRNSLHKTTSTTSSTAELEDDFQPEVLYDFNTVENIYENPTEKIIEGIYDKPLDINHKNLSVKEV